ncbi:MAG: hypothetical protein Athens101428_227 [Candidatus Berkelbacteria bacterium Athens1014_28]|uniref:Uncharacterized protein n=1 Tax=Candidatus Berkelbacteria bacterium Athens1014_28 TaxID=2017145 RepID=A0A554LNZ6_9BACT|nr:MAG: hypothetical protein Athens101428_227 [Candidatus Berkelbacteria bacterium Athens1014_28]
MPGTVKEPTDLVAENAEVPTTKKTKKINQEPEDEIIDPQTKKFIRKDVRLIFFTLLGLAVVLIIIKILQLKTNYVSDFGNWLYKIFNINTG